MGRRIPYSLMFGPRQEIVKFSGHLLCSVVHIEVWILHDRTFSYCFNLVLLKGFSFFQTLSYSSLCLRLWLISYFILVFYLPWKFGSGHSLCPASERKRWCSWYSTSSSVSLCKCNSTKGLFTFTILYEEGWSYRKIIYFSVSNKFWTK